MIYDVVGAYALYTGKDEELMDDRELYNAGIDRVEGVKRFMGNAEVYDSLLDDFVEDEDFPTAKAAYSRGDMEALYMAIHSVKGVAGNLSFFEIYSQAEALNEKLKTKNYDMLASDMAALERSYEKARAAIVEFNRR